MSILFYAALAFLALLLVAWLLVTSPAARIANGMRLAGQLTLAAIGAGLIFTGRATMGGMMLMGAASWFLSSRVKKHRRSTPGQTSTVRTAALEMVLDHDSGELHGLILAGHKEGKQLGDLSLEDLLELHEELRMDEESRLLLETYLDGRFTHWRVDGDAQTGDRQGGPPTSGAMTEEEAHKVLGLEPGASTADIRKAHRRLMQRVHPDVGGSSFLASRINEAKDFLLSRTR